MLNALILICKLHCHHLCCLDVINSNCSMIVAADRSDTPSVKNLGITVCSMEKFQASKHLMGGSPIDQYFFVLSFNTIQSA